MFSHPNKAEFQLIMPVEFFSVFHIFKLEERIKKKVKVEGDNQENAELQSINLVIRRFFNVAVSNCQSGLCTEITIDEVNLVKACKFKSVALDHWLAIDTIGGTVRK